jgi:serine O-acetyltransferase
MTIPTTPPGAAAAAPPGSDPIWAAIRAEAAEDIQAEPFLASHLQATILDHPTLERALSFLLAHKLASPTLPASGLREVFATAMAADPGIGEALRADLRAVLERDPACQRYSTPLLFFKGFHAIQSYRIGHWLWGQGRTALALTLQSRISEVFAVDFHPAARIGKGILLDHATGVVVGETAVIENNVSLLHAVTLGGTGKERGDRHPKVGQGVLIGAGAKLLGNIRIGEGVKIGAGSVVLTDIPPHTTAVGVPARIVERPRTDQPALDMDHRVNKLDG